MEFSLIIIKQSINYNNCSTEKTTTVNKGVYQKMVMESVEAETNLSEAKIFKLEYEDYGGDCLSERLNHKSRVNSGVNSSQQ